ncbi:MAG: GNAT family N-acetyltransferase [Anaerolineaceae bacterium]|nr:GNAT family N-acetyltransferase [Anaerolineaceae bacterium]
MQLHLYSSALAFLNAAQPALEAAEAANNLMYGLALRIRDFPERFLPAPYLCTVLAAKQLQVAALMTPPHNLVVFSNHPARQDQAFALIAQNLLRDEWSVPGVLGPNAAALAFAQAWQNLTGKTYSLTMRERVYELRQVTPPPQPPGYMRPALETDIEMVARWTEEFQREALPDEANFAPEQYLENARLRIKDRTYYLWQDGIPVALAGWTRPTPHGCSIGPVYTPREFRSKGYASALTAGLSQLLLDQGKQFTALFTNLANPTSNSIYQKIGYRPVTDFDLYRFG